MFRNRFFRKIAAAVVLIFALISALFLIDPTEGQLILILIPVILSWLIIYLITSVVIDVFIPKKKETLAKFLAAALSSAVLFFGLLSGIGTIGVVDVVLTAILVAVSGFYVSRIW